MIKCFGVFSEVIAFVYIGSQFVAVRTLLPLHHRIDAHAASARGNEVGEASIVRFGPPTSRRGIADEWDVFPPPQRPEWCFDGHPKRLPDFNSGSQAAPSARRGEPLVRSSRRRGVGIPGPLTIRPVKQTGQTTDPYGTEFVGANRLFARLVLHQVRPRDRSAAAAKPRTGSPRNRNPGPVRGSGSGSPDGIHAGIRTAFDDPPAASSGPLLAP